MNIVGARDVTGAAAAMNDVGAGIGKECFGALNRIDGRASRLSKRISIARLRHARSPNAARAPFPKAPGEAFNMSLREGL
jgi:hypothetical protein